MDYRKLFDSEKEDMASTVREAAPKQIFPELFERTIDPDRIYTFADIEALPEGVYAELMDGKIIYMDSPATTHQRIIARLFLKTANYIQKKGGDCEAFLSPFGVFPENDDSEYLLPDLVVVCDPSKIDEKGCHGAPDWVVEVLSPSTSKRDYGVKLFRYKRAGVREYWIIDPIKRTVMVYVFDRPYEEGGLYSFDEEIICSIYPDLKIRLSDMI